MQYQGYQAITTAVNTLIMKSRVLMFGVSWYCISILLGFMLFSPPPPFVVARNTASVNVKKTERKLC